jgi:hypothetical protein
VRAPEAHLARARHAGPQREKRRKASHARVVAGGDARSVPCLKCQARWSSRPVTESVDRPGCEAMKLS